MMMSPGDALAVRRLPGGKGGVRAGDTRPVALHDSTPVRYYPGLISKRASTYCLRCPVSFHPRPG
jgi:hypothetical protein